MELEYNELLSVIVRLEVRIAQMENKLDGVDRGLCDMVARLNIALEDGAIEVLREGATWTEMVDYIRELGVQLNELAKK